MRIIIAGGTGLIGRELAADLAAGGHEVIVLSRSPEKNRSILPAGVQVEGWDGRSTAGWGRLADGAGAIVNLAGANLSGGRWTARRKQILRSSRLEPGAAIVEAIRAAGQKPGVLVQQSAVGYYGPCGDEILTEKAPPGIDFLSRLVVDWEASTQAVEQMGVRRVTTRSGVILNRREGALPRMLMPYHFFVGGPVASGRQWISWIHLKDEVAGIRFVIEHPEVQGVVNLTSPQPLPNREFSKNIGKVMHRPALIPAPAFALHILFGEMSTVVLDGQRVVPERLIQAGFRFTFPTAQAALQDILG